MNTSAAMDNALTPFPPAGSTDFFRAIVATATNPYVIIDNSFVLRYASPSISGLVGRNPEDWIGRSVTQVLSPHSLELATEAFAELEMAPDDPNWVAPPVRLILLDVDGADIPVDAYVRDSTHTGVDGILVQLVRAGGPQTMSDAVDTILAGQDLDHALSLLTSLTEHEIPGTAAMLGSEWTGSGFTRVAGRDRLLFLTSPDPIDRRAIDRLLRGDDEIVDLFGDLAPHTRAAAEHRGRRACWCARVPADEGDEPTAALFIWRKDPGPPGVFARDRIQQSVNLARVALRWMGHQQALAWSATHDHLTGLTNRAEFQNRLDATAGASRAVLFCDLDDFKPVNEDLGHRAGDRVIAAVADRLRNACGTCVVARLGGDEFAVLANPIPTLDAAIGLAGQLQRTLADPIVTGTASVVVGMTVGIAFDPSGEADSDHLMDEADGLLRRGKSQGKNQILATTFT